MKPIRAVKKTFTNKQFGNALELYYHKGYNDKVALGVFLCYVFKIDDIELKRMDMYPYACRYFKENYVVD